jgi:hypothetical protein
LLLLYPKRNIPGLCKRTGKSRSFGQVFFILSYEENLSKRPGYPMLQVVPFRVNEAGGLLVTLFQVATKPGGATTVPPGAIVPLYERFVAVTSAPTCVKPALKNDVITCPLGKVNWRVQLLIAVLPVFAIVMPVVKPKLN